MQWPDDLDIDSSLSDKWIGCKEDSYDDEFTYYKKITSGYDTASECFDAVLDYYNDNKITPKKIVSDKPRIKIFEKELLDAENNIDQYFKHNHFSITDNFISQEAIQNLIPLRHDIELTLSYFDVGVNDTSTTTKMQSVLTDEYIAGEMYHISDRWRCLHRVHFLSDVIDYFDK